MAMRIGMVCPYSLTIPGGVQMQVLGLARELREQGYAVQVLAPSDGAPPEAGVTALGKSIPFATNGSVAPIAPDPSAAIRTIRSLRSEQFDILHVHEPLVPGPAVTAVLSAEVHVPPRRREHCLRVVEAHREAHRQAHHRSRGRLGGRSPDGL
jgi:phosphatidyl-myo-inositol alpha-mannosyltransferase